MLTMVRNFTRDAASDPFPVTKYDFTEIEHFGNYASAEDQAELESALRSMPYDKFLKTFYWLAVKSRAIADAKARCQQCYQKGKPLDVHHDSYSQHGSEHKHMRLLRALCRSCHEGWHKAHKGDAELRELMATRDELIQRCAMPKARPEDRVEEPEVESTDRWGRW